MARVLLVEGDRKIRELTALRLQVDGHHVFTAVDTDAALAVALDGPRFDVALANVLPPAAPPVLEALRNNESTRTLPVVTYLAYANTLVVQGLSLGSAGLTEGQPLLRVLATVNSLAQPGYAPIP